MNTNEYAEEKQNIFLKFFGFIKRLFKSTQALPAPDILDDDITTTDNKLDSINEITVEPQKEDTALLDLQQKFESNQISLAELSDEDLNNLNALYLRQIDDLNFQLNKTTF